MDPLVPKHKIQPCHLSLVSDLAEKTSLTFMKLFILAYLFLNSTFKKNKERSFESGGTVSSVDTGKQFYLL